MFLRFLSTVVLAPVALAAIWFGRPYFDVMVGLVGVIAIVEWVRVSEAGGTIGISPLGRVIWPVAGFLYIGAACFGLLVLRADAAQGRGLVLTFFAVIWATDIGAYLVGRTIGGPKLARTISPKKTWSGAIGGTLCGVISGLFVGNIAELPYFDVTILVGSAAISIVSQVGDLVESWWKRRFNVKDSGNLIPGHGGILDRIDGVLLASPFAVAGHWLAHGVSLPWK